MRPEDMMIAMKNMLKPGQTFRFQCDQCGDCCRHRTDILLTPFDLNRIARHMGTTPQVVVERYCIVYVGESSHFPVVLLKAVGKDEACPFLKDNRCSIHQHKPTVCALFPLGRAMMYDRKTVADNNVGSRQERKLFYFLQDIHCGTKGETHTVKEWLGEFDLADSEAWFFEWSDALGRLSVEIHALEKLVPERVMQMVFNTVFNEIYLNYYGGMDFMQQFRTNTEKVETLLRGLKEKIMEMKGSDKA